MPATEKCTCGNDIYWMDDAWRHVAYWHGWCPKAEPAWLVDHTAAIVRTIEMLRTERAKP